MAFSSALTEAQKPLYPFAFTQSRQNRFPLCLAKTASHFS
jgi:hypothetical protein